ncbi:MAG: hypothetical protein KIT00_04910 [Rhodospirillales bacterium]|nr:hypothetical protein [Rhodospirillales bacterium]
MTSLLTALCMSAGAMFNFIHKQSPVFEPPVNGRIDFETDDPRVFNGRYAVVGSHHSFPFHRRFATDFKLVTVLRDPYRRIVSAYSYGCMRAKRAPALDAFVAFFRDPNNQNIATKTFASDTAAPQPDADAAFEILHRHFWLFGVTEHIDAIASGYLSHCGFPNVLMERLNSTRPEYRIDATAFEDEIRALNRADCQLYDLVRKENRVPLLPKVPQTLHCHTVVVKEAENSDKCISVTDPLPTRDLLPHLQQGPASLARFF